MRRPRRVDWTRLPAYLPSRLPGLRLVVAPILGAVAAALLLVGLVAVYPYVASPGIIAHYGDIHRRTRAIAIAGGGELLGVAPLEASPGRAGATHFYLPAKDINPHWIHLVRAMEDRRLGSFGSVSCLDLLAIAKAAALHVKASQNERGASSLCQLTSRAMRNLSPTADRNDPSSRYGRKFTEMRDGMAIYHAYGGIDDPRFQELLASHFELVRGSRGSFMGPTIRGVEAAAQVLWGKRQEELSIAESALLAAAVRRPIVVAPEDDPAGLAEAGAQFEKARKRAMGGIREAYAADDPRALAAIEELRAMETPQPYLDPSLSVLADAPRERFEMATNLARRAQRIIGPELQVALGELKDSLGTARLSEIDGISLTLDPVANRRWGDQVAVVLAHAMRRIEPKPLADLSRRQGGATDPYVAVVRVDGTGAIVRHYSNRRDLAFFNGEPGERGPDGRYRVELAARPIGSIGKGPAAVLLASRAKLADRWCNRRIDGKIGNPNGDTGVRDCSASGATRSVEESFARSLNLAVIDGLRAVRDSEIRGAAAAMNVRLPADVTPRIALPLGMATARPSDLLMLYGAIARGSANQPHIVAAVRLRGEGGWRVPPGYQGSSLDLRRYIGTPASETFVRGALAAPLRPGGTMAAIGAELPPGSAFIGKSGTVFVNGRTYHKYAIVASLDGRGDTLLYFGSANSRSPIATEMGWSAFGPLVALATR